jgi:hypothetical protein
MERKDRRNGCRRAQSHGDYAYNPALRRKKKFEAAHHDEDRQHFEIDDQAPAPPIRGQRLVISI